MGVGPPGRVASLRGSADASGTATSSAPIHDHTPSSYLSQTAHRRTGGDPLRARRLAGPTDRSSDQIAPWPDELVWHIDKLDGRNTKCQSDRMIRAAKKLLDEFDGLADHAD